jgi:hypothetical protein
MAQLDVVHFHLMQIGLIDGQEADVGRSFHAAAGRGQLPGAKLTTTPLDVVGDAAHGNYIPNLHCRAELDEQQLCVLDEQIDELWEELRADALSERAQLLQGGQVEGALSW